MECQGDETQLDRELGRAFPGHWRVVSVLPGAVAGGIVVWIAADLMPQMDIRVKEIAPGRVLCVEARAREVDTCLRLHVVHNFGLSQPQLRHWAGVADEAMRQVHRRPRAVMMMLLGDWNYLEGDDKKARVGGNAVAAAGLRPGERVCQSVLARCTEAFQPRPTHFDAASLGASRPDRAYIGGPWAHVVGTPASWCEAHVSDHSPLRVTVGRPQRRRVGCAPIPVHAVRSSHFGRRLALLETAACLDDVAAPLERLELHKQLLGEAGRGACKDLEDDVATGADQEMHEDALALGAFWAGDLLLWRRIVARAPRLAAHFVVRNGELCARDTERYAEQYRARRVASIERAASARGGSEGGGSGRGHSGAMRRRAALWAPRRSRVVLAGIRVEGDGDEGVEVFRGVAMAPALRAA